MDANQKNKTNIKGQMHIGKNERTNEQSKYQGSDAQCKLHIWTNERTKKRTNEQTKKRMNKQTN